MLGLLALVPFARYELGQERADRRRPAAARRPGQWPVQLTAFLFGMSVLGAQIPLSTFARTDPDVAGYGLGRDASFVSTLIGVYVVFLAIGAFTLPLTSRGCSGRAARWSLRRLLVALGYALWLPFHDHTWQALLNMAVAGLGSGRAGRRPARDGRRGGAGRPHRLRHRHDQRDQDHRRRDRVGGLRDRLARHRLASTTRSRATPRCRATSPSGRSARSPPCCAALALLALPRTVAEEPTPPLR